MSAAATRPADAGLGESEAQAWRPVLAVGYGLLAVAAFLFLSSGFASLTALRTSLGSLGPGSERLAPFWGLLVLLVIAVALGHLLAGRQLARAADGTAVMRQLLTVVVIALALSFPPVQWLTFGRASASAGHDHGGAASAASTCAPAAVVTGGGGPADAAPAPAPAAPATPPAVDPGSGLYALSASEHAALADARPKVQTLAKQPAHKDPPGAAKHAHPGESPAPAHGDKPGAPPHEHGAAACPAPDAGASKKGDAAMDESMPGMDMSQGMGKP